jgi:hypothetical protein
MYSERYEQRRYEFACGNIDVARRIGCKNVGSNSIANFDAATSHSDTCPAAIAGGRGTQSDARTHSNPDAVANASRTNFNCCCHGCAISGPADADRNRSPVYFDNNSGSNCYQYSGCAQGYVHINPGSRSNVDPGANGIAFANSRTDGIHKFIAWWS